MNKFLVVNADDFALCENITRGIIQAYNEGIVTATSVVANGAYLKEGIRLLKETGIDAGIHLTLVGGEKSLTGPIKGITDDHGSFQKSYRKVLVNLITGRFDRRALKKELVAQLSLLKDHGIQPSHLDSHQHLHLVPSVREIVIVLAKYFGIRWVRLTSSRGVGIEILGLNYLSHLAKMRLKEEKIFFVDQFLGFLERGRIDERILLFLLRRVQKGVTELMVHPGYDASGSYPWGYRWTEELSSLISPEIKRWVRDLGIKLVSFRQLQ